MDIISLPDTIVAKITAFLDLDDLIALGDCHSKFRNFIYKNPEIWTSDLLFPEASQKITDKFIQKFVPKITRHYGILTLKMIDLLSLSPFGYLLVFDQFAHSVKRIEIRTTPAILTQLVHHLTIFAGNLALLQQNNNIPITFRQYAFDDEREYETTLVNSSLYSSQGNNLISYLQSQIQLDDPPFERLEEFSVSCASDDHNNTIQQLEVLTLFLSGRTGTNVQTERKRSRDDYLQSPVKYRKHHVNQYQFHHGHKVSYY